VKQTGNREQGTGNREQKRSFCSLFPVPCSLFLLFALPSALFSAPDDVPVVGRPSDLPFSEASGWFDVRTRAEPTTVEAETPLTFTLLVRALRSTRRPPQRIDLRQLSAFEEQFFIEDSSEEPNRPDEKTWEFVYHLKPRRTAVTEVPSLPFVYFNPYLLTARKGFQVVYTDPVPLSVLPHKTVEVPLRAPESAFVLAAGPAVLKRQTLWTTPGVGTSVALLLIPPAGCIIWYLCWRRLYPDTARQASQRRSRAARQALQQLQAARRLDAEQRAERTAATLIGYLQERLDLAIAEPTPREVADLFSRRNFSPALTMQAVHLFEACDRARFLPTVEIEQADLLDIAIRFILAVEEETCPVGSS
jgi:hypothetical protein